MRSAMRNRLANLRTLVRKRRVTSDEEILGIAQLLWSQLDTPLSLGLSLLVKNGQLEDALKVEIHPSRYLDSEGTHYADDSQAIAFLKKMPLVIRGVDRQKAAWENFLQCEEMCQQTNARFRSLREGHGCDPAVSAVLHASQLKISRWLGSLDAKSWALRCRFGPGADISTRGRRVSAYHKLSKLSSTEDFSEGAAALVYSHPSWARALLQLEPEESLEGINSLEVELVPGNKLVFVPKTALIDRSIAIEPRLNIYAQLGLGALLRQRLKRFADLDLDDQTPSQELAHTGSLFGTVATVDLSSASDTLSKELVRDLLPEPWFNAMDWCRSKVGLYTDADGVNNLVQYQKFSSMGNGFTFELESMIFYALTLSCVEYCRDDVTLVRAYGDDIACPVKSVDLLVKVLMFCGFQPNTRKTFSSGVFRESCGHDYFKGRNVRPYYQKESLYYVESLFRLANGIRRVAVRRNRTFGCDSLLHSFWCHVTRRIPASLRALRGPFRLVRCSFSDQLDVEADDSYLACNLDEAMSSPFVRRNPHGWDGWLYTGMIPSGRHVDANIGEYAVLYAFALYACRDGSSAVDSPHSKDGNRLISVRGNGPRRVVSGLFAPDFYDVGPWV